MTDLTDARQGAREGEDRAARHANPEWLEAADRALRAVAGERETFTTDDVWDRLTLISEVETPEPRAMAAVFRRAVGAGVCKLLSCEHCGTRKVMRAGRSRASHAGDVPVYLSLTFQRVAVDWVGRDAPAGALPGDRHVAEPPRLPSIRVDGRLHYARSFGGSWTAIAQPSVEASMWSYGAGLLPVVGRITLPPAPIPVDGVVFVAGGLVLYHWTQRLGRGDTFTLTDQRPSSLT